mmetsp:Transcript_124888/g.388780  ORF Transcript_124888/g.388780 Transcript_124888/m.388780 type:complete len:269 (-) Transcript_124888:1001-1807(-)
MLVLRGWRYDHGHARAQCGARGARAAMVHDARAPGEEPLVRRRGQAEHGRVRVAGEAFGVIRRPWPVDVREDHVESSRAQPGPAGDEDAAAPHEREGLHDQVSQGPRACGVPHAAPAHVDRRVCGGGEELRQLRHCLGTAKLLPLLGLQLQLRLQCPAACVATPDTAQQLLIACQALESPAAAHGVVKHEGRHARELPRALLQLGVSGKAEVGDRREVQRALDVALPRGRQAEARLHGVLGVHEGRHRVHRDGAVLPLERQGRAHHAQ